VVLSLRTNNTTALRLAPGVDSADPGTAATPNLIGGDGSNSVGASIEGASIGGGNGNSVTAAFGTVGGGQNNSATALNATVPGGAGAVATQQGEMAYANGSFAAAGDAQASTFILRRTTVGNQTNQSLYLDGTSLRLLVPAGETWTFTVWLTGRSSTGLSAGYMYIGAVENVGGNVQLVGTPTSVGGFFGTGFEDESAWESRVIADNTTDSFDVQVTTANLAGGTQTRWVARVEIVQVVSP
jgi:hypothetical protein